MAVSNKVEVDSPWNKYRQRVLLLITWLSTFELKDPSFRDLIWQVLKRLDPELFSLLMSVRARTTGNFRVRVWIDPATKELVPMYDDEEPENAQDFVFFVSFAQIHLPFEDENTYLAFESPWWIRDQGLDFSRAVVDLISGRTRPVLNQIPSAVLDDVLNRLN